MQTRSCVASLLLACVSFATSPLLRSASAAEGARMGTAQPGKVVAQRTVKSGLPPLLDRELFFGNPEIIGARLSPDGQFIAFLRPWKDTRNVWVKKTSEPFSAARLVTAEAKRPVPGFFWTRDSRYILFTQDKDGDENYNVFAVDPGTPAPAGQEAPPARNITAAKGARAYIYALPKRDPDTIYIGLNDRDAAWHDLYKVKISTGERTLMRQNSERISGWVFDLEGQLRLAARTAENGDTEILRADAAGFTKVYSCSVLETCGVDRFHKDGQHVYMETNKGDGVDLARLVLFDPASGREELVESDPLGRVDFGFASFSEATDELVATGYQDERRRMYFRDKAVEADYKHLGLAVAGKEVRVSSATADDQLWLMTAVSDREPGETYLFDRRTKKLALQYRIRERIPRGELAAVKPIRYPSSDGLVIPAYLTLPKGVLPQRLPLIALPHGGPWGRDSWGYDGMAQFLANRGYAVLQPNFRSSTGYGKKFLNAGNKQWGEKMQDDITWGVKYLVAQGIADPKRVGIMGGSYGGYATLAGVAFTPDVYAAAVSVVGPSNLITLLDSIPPYWEAGRIMFHERMGNPNTPEGKQRLERQSPLNSAQKIKTPLLVAQGANDPRVKKAESEQIVIALRDRRFPVEYLLAPDEGHGFARPVNNMAFFAAAEKFLGTYLHSRFQEGATPEVATRLKEITVDPKTVVLTPKVEPAAAGMPTPVADLVPATANYQGKVEAGGQTMPISITSTIKEEGDTWAVTAAAKLPMGEMVDTVWVRKGDLAVVKRSVRRGPVAIDVAFKDGKAEGSMVMSGQSRPISVDCGGPLFADGAAGADTIAALPLADGFTTTFRNLDLQRQKVVLKRLSVKGREDVMVPAGTFKAWKVEVVSAEGEAGQITLWVATEPRKVVKAVEVLAAMGGAIVTTELQP